MTKRHFKNATVYMHALSLIYLLSHCSISSPFLLLLRLAHFSLFHPTKKNNKPSACHWAYRLIIVWGQIGLCRRQKFAPLTELGARFTPSSFPYCSISSHFLLLLRLAHFSLFHHAKKNNKPSACHFFWWGQIDSNYRPHAYQACALTN